MTACECDARDDGATAYHKGNPDGCPREAADHTNGWPGNGEKVIVSSPALCLPCLFGCAE